MPILPETESVFAELAASRTTEFGVHGSNELKVGGNGQMVSEVPFDPTLHLPTDLNPFSLMEIVTGQPYAAEVIPKRPLSVNIVTHHEAGRSDIFTPHKTRLAAALLESIVDSVPGMTDRVYAYHVGEIAPEDIDRETELIDTNGDDQVATKSIAELCREGLTFVISDFNKLRLDSMSTGEFPATVGIKVNHPGEIAFPANVGTISLGGRREVNTDKPKQLMAWNLELSQKNAAIVERLENVGIKVASVIFDTARRNDLGFDIDTADKSVAAALGRLKQF